MFSNFNANEYKISKQGGHSPFLSGTKREFGRIQVLIPFLLGWQDAMYTLTLVVDVSVYGQPGMPLSSQRGVSATFWHSAGVPGDIDKRKLLRINALALLLSDRLHNYAEN